MSPLGHMYVSHRKGRMGTGGAVLVLPEHNPKGIYTMEYNKNPCPFIIRCRGHCPLRIGVSLSHHHPRRSRCHLNKMSW